MEFLVLPSHQHASPEFFNLTRVVIILPLIDGVAPVKSGVVRVWSKETGLGPVGVGLRGFKPHTPH